MKLIDQLDLYFEALDKISDKEAAQDFDSLDDKDIDNDGDVDDTDSYLHNKLGNVAKNVNEADDIEQLHSDFMRMLSDKLSDNEARALINQLRRQYDDEEIRAVLGPLGLLRDEMMEMSTTAAVPGDIKTPYAFGKKEDEKDNAEVVGYKKVQESAYKRMMRDVYGIDSIDEAVTYSDFKKDPKSTPQQKVNRGIAEVNRMLAEMEKIVNNNLRLKQEMGVDSSHFWKTTGNRFAKINERMTRISNRLRELSK